MTFVFWELVGICSYFLIGFYIERHGASTAANKAFIVNRVGDFGMLIGLMTMVDTGKRDHKILAVAVDDPEYQRMKDFSELPPHRLAMLRRFFQDYKTLEQKAVEVDEFQAAAATHEVIDAALHRYSSQRRAGFHGS